MNLMLHYGARYLTVCALQMLLLYTKKTKQNKTTQRAFGGCFAAGNFTPVFICSDQELSIDTGRELCTKG